ncbi:unnamed protein product [Chironomus riparius]|uniref:F-box domain-containing protein n=1 Tax=Chironomus riparius TaxID=315576 RepID=A0A9N9WPR9_9DIPT|nr:unnamed protein product [Chironomus riparius]
MGTSQQQIDTKDKDIEVTQKFIQKELENQHDKIITLDLATLDKIPDQLYNILRVASTQNYTQFTLLNCIVLYSAYESSLIGDWCQIDLSNYTLSWCSAFNQRILEHCTFPKDICINNNLLQLTFKFTLEQSRKIVLNSLESGDFALLSIYELKDLDKTHFVQSKSITLPISRYVPFKKLCDHVPNSFRNLKELSVLLKENLFIPIRNQMYDDCAVLSCPWLNGLPDCVLVKILKYLNKKDLHSLKCTCRKQYDLCKAFASNKKRKFE